jgi:hypothetical protein
MQKKTYDKIQHPFRIKTLKKLGREVTNLIIIKAMYSKPTANITTNEEKLKAFPVKLGLRVIFRKKYHMFSVICRI